MPRRPKPFWSARDQCYRTDVGGTPHYFRGITRDDHVGVARAFAAYLAERDALDRPPEPDVLDLCNRFCDAGRRVKPRTVRTHRERLARFCDFPEPGPASLGARRAATLKAKDLRDALRAWEAAGLSDHYRAGLCRSVKAAFAWAATEEGGRLIAADPFAEVKGPTVGRAPVRYATRREVAAFLRFAWRRFGATARAGTRHVAGRAWREAEELPSGTPTPCFGELYLRFGRRLLLMLRVAAHTGARPGDLAAAWWADFDAAAGTITLPPDRHKTGGKTTRPRVIFLTPALVRALRRERDREGRHPVAIFTHKRGRGGVARGAERDAGEPWGEFATLPDGRPSFDADTGPLARAVRGLRAEAVAEAKRRASAGEPLRGLEAIRDEGHGRFVFYLLRHTTASDHLMGGGAPATVAEILGTSVRMLETTYGHLLEDHLRRAARELHSRRRGSTGNVPTA
jgi:integrase